MSNTVDSFDPYYKWLGIPPEEQPANYYRLLGLKNFESDRDVIGNAADQKMVFIRTFQSGQHSAESQHLLNELSLARVTLLDEQKKKKYDDSIRQQSLAKEIPSIAPPINFSQQPSLAREIPSIAPPLPPEPPVSVLPPPPVLQKEPHSSKKKEKTNRQKNTHNSRQKSNEKDNSRVTPEPEKAESLMEDLMDYSDLLAELQEENSETTDILTDTPVEFETYHDNFTEQSHVLTSNTQHNSNKSDEKKTNKNDSKLTFSNSSTINFIDRYFLVICIALFFVFILFLNCRSLNKNKLTVENETVENDEQNNSKPIQEVSHETIYTRLNKSREKYVAKVKAEEEAKKQAQIKEEKRLKAVKESKILNDIRWADIDKQYFFVYIDNQTLDYSRLNVQLNNLDTNLVSIEIIQIEDTENKYTFNNTQNVYSVLQNNVPIGFEIIINPPVIVGPLTGKTRKPDNFLDININQSNIYQVTKFVKSCVLKMTFDNPISKKQETKIVSFLNTEINKDLADIFYVSVKEARISELQPIFEKYALPDYLQSVKVSCAPQKIFENYAVTPIKNTIRENSIQIKVETSHNINYKKAPLFWGSPKDKTIVLDCIIINIDYSLQNQLPISYRFTIDGKEKSQYDIDKEALPEITSYIRAVLDKINFGFDLYYKFPDDNTEFIGKRIKINQN